MCVCVCGCWGLARGMNGERARGRRAASSFMGREVGRHHWAAHGTPKPTCLHPAPPALPPRFSCPPPHFILTLYMRSHPLTPQFAHSLLLLTHAVHAPLSPSPPTPSFQVFDSINADRWSSRQALTACVGQQDSDAPHPIMDAQLAAQKGDDATGEGEVRWGDCGGWVGWEKACLQR